MRKLVDGSSKIVLDFLLSAGDEAFTREEVIKGVNPDPTPEFCPLPRCDGSTSVLWSRRKERNFKR